MMPITEHRLDIAARLFAGRRSRRHMVRTALRCAAFGIAGGSLAGCGDEAVESPASLGSLGSTAEEGIISCDTCMDLVGIVWDEAIGAACSGAAARGIGMLRVVNPWTAILTGAVCLTKYLLPTYDRRTICSHGVTDRLFAFAKGAPCRPADCGDGDVLCGVPGSGKAICVERCPGETVLDQSTCTCLASAATGAGGDDGSLPGEGRTEGGAPRRWVGYVREASVLVAQARRLEFAGAIWGERGVHMAIPQNSPVDMTLTDGSFWVVPMTMAPITFCETLERYRADHGEPALISGLPDWGTDAPCNVSGSPGTDAVYRSATYGYSLPYGGDWTLERSTSWLVGDGSGGYDQARFRHTDGKTVIALTGTPQWGSDLPACLAGVQAGIDELDNTGPLEPASWVDHTPVDLPVPPGETAAFTYVLTDGSASENRVTFIECAVLVPGSASLVVLFETTADSYAAREPDRHRFLRALTFDALGITPSPANDDSPSISPTIAPKT